MEHKEIRKTELMCGSCKKNKLIVTEGSETPEMLYCTDCGQYYYLVGNIQCCCVCVVDNDKGEIVEDDIDWDDIERELKSKHLKPEIRAKISQMGRLPI